MGIVHCPYCDRDIEVPEIGELPGITDEQENFLWQMKDIAYKLYGEAYTHPDVQRWVKVTTENINDFLKEHGRDPSIHRIRG